MSLRPALRLLATLAIGGSLSVGCATTDDDFAAADLGTTQAPLLKVQDAIDGEYIVVFKSSASKSSITAAANRVGTAGDQSAVRHSFDVIPGFSGKLSPAALNGLLNNPNVAYVEENGLVYAGATHSVGTGLEGLDRADQRQLPLSGTYDDGGNTGAGVNVYIVDTGINQGHNEFTGRVAQAADFVGDGRNGEDCDGHGSHVASTALGTDFGLAKDATLHGVRVLNCQGSGTFDDVIAGIDFVAADCPNQGGPCVANMSLGGGFSSALNDAVANAVSSGVPFVVAAGNESTDACSRSPASEPSAITVGSTDDDDTMSFFSNFGSCVDIFANGRGVLGANSGTANATQTISGTSMASPHVAGAIAQFLGANPNASPNQVENALKDSATPDCVSSLPSGANLLLFGDFTQSGAGLGCDGGGDPGDPVCEPAGASCDSNSDCCSNKCRGRRGNKTCR